MFALYFILWTFYLYWLHRLVHLMPYTQKIHAYHHAFINKNETHWHWSNLFLFTDQWICAVDLWMTDVIPTIVFCYLTGQWWICVFYYVWAAVIQETIEHDPCFDYYPFIHSGKWHLEHHSHGNKNYGMFIVYWDKLFKTST